MHLGCGLGQMSRRGDSERIFQKHAYIFNLGYEPVY
jgi:hypothetical protein